MEQIKIAIAERQDILRASLVDYLAKEDHFEIVLDTAGGLDLMDKLSIWKVDVLFLSTSLLGYRGEEALKIIHESKEVPNLKVVMFSNLTDSDSVKEIMQLGANSILKKTAESEIIVETIETIYKEGYCFNKNFTKELLESVLTEIQN
jgi:DNA-binding NarL/FixJ family response regulator